jgi:hypothetical protein
METTGRAVNRKILECGCVALVDLAGDRLYFYPRNKLPQHLIAYLNIGERRHLRMLRDYCVNIARGLITD